MSYGGAGTIVGVEGAEESAVVGFHFWWSGGGIDEVVEIFDGGDFWRRPGVPAWVLLEVYEEDGEGVGVWSA